MLTTLALVVCALVALSGVGGVYSHGADGEEPSDGAGAPSGPDVDRQPDRSGSADAWDEAEPGSAGEGRSEEAEERTDSGASHGPTPRPDPTREAYRAVRAGDCLTPDGPGTADGGAAELPTPVGCETAAAFHRVTDVASAPDGCPTGAGLSTWYHTSADGSTTALCLERVFRAGQCFAALRVPATAPGRPEGAADAPDMVDADLRTPLACDTSEVPDPYNAVLRVTEVRPTTPADVGGTGASCGDQDGDRWYWIANGGRTLVCATVAD